MIECMSVQSVNTYSMMFISTINDMKEINVIAKFDDIVFVKFAFNIVC